MHDTNENLIQTVSEAFLQTVPAAQRALRSRLAKAVQGKVSIPQYRVLVSLLDQPGMTLKLLAEGEGVEPATMSRTVEGLVHRGWVSRAVSSDDRRAVALEITDAGDHVVRELRSHLAAGLQEHFAHWKKDDLRSLLGALNLLAFDPLSFAH